MASGLLVNAFEPKEPPSGLSAFAPLAVAQDVPNVIYAGTI